MQKWLTVPMETSDLKEGIRHAPQLMQLIYDNFTGKNGDKKYLFSYGLQERKADEVTDRHIIMDNLRYDGNILFGSIGVVSRQIDGMIRERDIVTYIASELVPSAPTKGFEYYTYFAIHAVKQQLLVLRNGSMPSYVHNTINRICQQAIESSLYMFEVKSYQEKTMRERIKELNKSRVELRVALSDIDLERKAGIRALRAQASDRGDATITMKMRFSKHLDENAIDALIDIRDDKDVKRLVVVDESVPSAEKETIDLLKEMMLVKRDVKVKKTDLRNVDLVWEKFREAMNPSTKDQQPQQHYQISIVPKKP
ncbi:MAG: hypothetical protein ACOX7B_03485 [Christensenellales bacterium]